MKALLLAVAVHAGACDTWANHPIASGLIVGGAVMAGGVEVAFAGHPIIGGTLIGLSISTFAVSIPIGIIIDNFNEEHRGARKACAP